MAEHTAGPWEVVRTEDGHEIRMGTAIKSPGNHQTQHLVEYNHGLEDDPEFADRPELEQFAEAEANAQLMNAAPDMLAELRRIEWIASGGFTFCPSCQYTQEGGHKTGCRLAAAITKATRSVG